MVNEVEFQVAVVRAGESYDRLARTLGISLQTMYNKIHGTSEFKGSEIKKLALALGLSMEDVNIIFFGGDVNLIHNPDEKTPAEPENAESGE